MYVISSDSPMERAPCTEKRRETGRRGMGTHRYRQNQVYPTRWDILKRIPTCIIDRLVVFPIVTPVFVPTPER